jgi:hypothetical protein
MATGLQSWSKTAASNSTADSNVNWAEGQTPGSVNNSARAEMASAAMWRDDNAGMITTGGTSTAYTATSNQTLSLSDGVTITLQMSATSGASPTLNVDSLGAKAIQGVSGTAIPTGALISGSVYRFTYRTSPDAWIVHGRFAPNEFAAGVAMVFYQDSAPTGWSIVTTNTNDVALRIVSGSGAGGGTGGALGGTTAFTTVLGARTIAAANLPDHDITITDPGHTHTLSVTVLAANAPGGGAFGTVTSAVNTTSSSTTGITAAFGTTARGGAQTTMDFAVKYASCVICTKS